jgi:hypothetical protein
MRPRPIGLRRDQRRNQLNIHVFSKNRPKAAHGCNQTAHVSVVLGMFRQLFGTMGLGRVFTLSVLCGLAACEGSFDEDVLVHGAGEVHGTVFGLTGGERIPIEGASVFLLDAAGARRSTLSSADGSFELRGVPAGPARLVVNDGGRRGGLRELTVYASGDNDAGELYVQPIEQVAALVDIPDVGFEERVTRVAANAEAAVQVDGAAVGARHRRVANEDGWLQWQLREVRVPSGEELVRFPVNYAPRAPVGLLDERFLTFGDCVYDTEADLPLCKHASRPLHRWAWNGAVYGVDASWSWAGHTTYHADLVRYFGERGGPVSLGIYDDFHPSLFSFSDGTLTTLSPGAEGGSALEHLDLETGAASAPIVVPHTWFPYYALVADGRDRAYYLADSSLGEVDFTTGTSRVLYGGGNPMYDLWPAGPSRLIVSGYLRHPGTSLWLMRTDRPISDGFSAVFTMLPRESHLTIGGRAVTLCEEHVAGDCSATYQPNGVIRIATHNTTPPNYVVDTDLDGNVLRKRVLDIEDPGTAIVERAGGGQEAIARRDAPSGFIQLWVAELDGSDEPQYRQVTFLPADHGTPFYSPDGDWLYSFVRDPLSGYVQLFRVRVRDRR